VFGSAAHFRELARLGHEVARAMAAAHARGIVHRDLKPENVLVTRALPRGIKIVDFGIAKAPPSVLSGVALASSTPHLTELGTVMGSPPYMAPEQNGAAHSVTGKADVYALGVMLMITALGLDPDELELGRTSFAVSHEVDRAFAAGPELPRGLQRLLRRMLQPEPEARPEMRDVALELQRLAQVNDEFADAVHAWVTENKIPKRRRVAAFLRWADAEPGLTDDERAFLLNAPAALLERRRLSGLLALASVAFSAALGAAWIREHRLHRGLDAALPEARKVNAPPPDEHATVVSPARTPSSAGVRGHSESSTGRTREPSVEAARTDGDAPRADGEKQPCRSRADELAECTRQHRSADQRAARAEARADDLTQKLADLQREVDSAAQARSDCRRELDTRIGELAESTNRLRLCYESLRSRASDGNVLGSSRPDLPHGSDPLEP
jgi:hypothetical protein